MEQQHLFNLSPPSTEDGVAEVRPNVWLMSTEETPPLLLDLEHTAACLGVDLTAVESLLRRGDLSGVRVEGVLRIPTAVIARYVARLSEVDQP